MSIDSQRVQYENKLRILLEALGAITAGGTVSASRISIINYVKAKLDELVPDGEGITFSLSSEPNVSDPYDLLINAHLDEATKDVILSAPLSVLTPTPFAGTAVPFTDTQTGYVVLPSDFLRLSSFRMTDWTRDVTVPLTPTHPFYNRQSNAFLRGGLSKPQAALSWKNFSTGGIKNITLAAGGTGYTEGVNTLVVVQTGGSGGTIKVTANSSGVVTSIDSIYLEGLGYAVANTLATTGPGTNCTVNITAINGLKKIIEYYSVNTPIAPATTTIDKLLYIPETTAENFVLINPSLLPSLAWMCAGKIMQILGMQIPFQMAMEQVKLSYNNL